MKKYTIGKYVGWAMTPRRSGMNRTQPAPVYKVNCPQGGMQLFALYGWPGFGLGWEARPVDSFTPGRERVWQDYYAGDVRETDSGAPEFIAFQWETTGERRKALLATAAVRGNAAQPVRRGDEFNPLLVDLAKEIDEDAGEWVPADSWVGIDKDLSWAGTTETPAEVCARLGVELPEKLAREMTRKAGGAV